jgi:integrase
MPRKPNQRSSIYEGSDGYWHGWVTVGVKADGSLDRRHRKARTEAEVTAKVRKLEGQRDSGQVNKAGRPPTVAEWLRTWLDTVAPQKASESTIETVYRPRVENWVVPRIGRHRLDRLQPEHLDALYLELADAGLSPKTILMTHQIISRALKMALRRHHISINVATLVDAPTHRESEIEPLPQASARALLAEASKRRNAARWSVAFGLGLRQSEALGMRWQYVDLDRRRVHVWQLKRRRFRHGCSNSHECGARYHTGRCRKNCTNHDRYCPQRTGGEWHFQRPKGDKTRHVPIPSPLISALRAHKAAQAAERLAAGETWEEWDLVFAGPDGRPINPRRDWAEWKRLLKAAGIRDARPHDARHTAATLLLEQGVDIRVVQEILGHSTLAVTKRYTHVTSKLADDAAESLGKALWA